MFSFLHNQMLPKHPKPFKPSTSHRSLPPSPPKCKDHQKNKQHKYDELEARNICAYLESNPTSQHLPPIKFSPFLLVTRCLEQHACKPQAILWYGNLELLLILVHALGINASNFELEQVPTLIHTQGRIQKGTSMGSIPSLGTCHVHTYVF